VCNSDEMMNEEWRSRLAFLFRRAQVGLAVNGVAHDVNNYLGAMLAYAELIELDEELGDESRRMAGEIIESVRKCGNLISVLTSIARRERDNQTMADPSTLVQQVLDMRSYDLRLARVNVEMDMPETPACLVVDQPKLTMALSCLVSNTMEALSEAKEGRLRVTLREENGVSRVTLWNSAPALTEEEAAQCFEPFYTTKGAKHLGLGLAVAREAARFHRGDLTYVPDEGFVLTLPQEYRRD
jgi:C4-dicarboxylate-specific signal transduction histidine kinase